MCENTLVESEIELLTDAMIEGRRVDPGIITGPSGVDSLDIDNCIKAGFIFTNKFIPPNGEIVETKFFTQDKYSVGGVKLTDDGRGMFLKEDNTWLLTAWGNPCEKTLTDLEKRMLAKFVKTDVKVSFDVDQTDLEGFDYCISDISAFIG